MREVEFLPNWYPRARRRRRLLRLQGLSTAGLVCGMGVWLVFAQHNLSAASAANKSANGQLAQSKLELQQLDEQLQLKQRLEVQRRIVSKLGLPVEMSRLITSIDHAMPPQMSLVELSIDTDEQLRSATPGVPNKNAAERADQPVDRRLQVKLKAIAPSEVDLANLLTALTNVPFFEAVQVGNSVDKSEKGHDMREFDVTFAMNLSRSGDE